MPDHLIVLDEAWFWAPDEDAVHDQGDEHCEDCGQELTMEGCGCERGEWVPMGMVDGEQLTRQDVSAAAARLLQTVEEMSPAIQAGLARVGEAAAKAVEQFRADRFPEIKLPVLGFDGSRDDGVVVQVALPPDHPAYAAVHAGLTDHLSIGVGSVEAVSDNEPYVKSPRGREPMHARRNTDFPAVSVASPAVNGLGREHIVDHLPLEHRVPYVQLPVALGGLPDDAPERHIPRPNRADRRRAKKRRG